MKLPIDHGEFAHASTAEQYFRYRPMVAQRVAHDDGSRRLSGHWRLFAPDGSRIGNAWYAFDTHHLYTDVELPPKRSPGGTRPRAVQLPRRLAAELDAWLLEQGHADPEFELQDRIRFGLARMIGVEPE